MSKILAKDFVELATTKQIATNNDGGILDCKYGYGFQQWMCKPKGVYRFDGAFGQYVIIEPKENMILAINETAKLGDEAQNTLDIIWDEFFS